MASLGLEERSAAYRKEEFCWRGGRREGKSLCRKHGGNVVSLKPPHPRALYEVGSWQMLASTALVWSPGVRVIGGKASQASFPCDRMDRAFVGFLGSTEKTLQPTEDQMLSPLY